VHSARGRASGNRADYRALRMERNKDYSVDSIVDLSPKGMDEWELYMYRNQQANLAYRAEQAGLVERDARERHAYWHVTREQRRETGDLIKNFGGTSA
jgi:hypothetical protein